MSHNIQQNCDSQKKHRLLWKRRIESGFLSFYPSLLYFWRMFMLENRFKTALIKDIERRFPGSIVYHLDPNERQGSPDLLILYKNKWAALEGKKNAKASHRPNQDYYVEKLNEMSYASFIFPENKEDVLNELQQAFET